MKYSITKLNDNNYNLFGIKLDNGSKCIYWSNKDITEYKEIIVIFDNKNVINVSDGQVCISLNGVNDKEDAMNMINAIGRELYKDGKNITKIKFRFMVDNKEEDSISNRIIEIFRLDGEVIKSDKYSYLTENLDDALSNISIKIPDKKIEEDKEIIDENILEENNVLDEELTREEKNDSVDEEGINKTLELSNIRKKILSEWLQDPAMKEEISSLSREELGKRLVMASNSFPLNNISNDSVEEQEENLIEKEDTNNSNELVEKEEAKAVLKVYKKPELGKNSFNSNNLVSNSINKVGNNSINNHGVDESFWDDDFGFADTPISMGSKSMVQDRITGKVKVLKKPKKPVYPRDDNKKPAFISLPVIIFIISLLLLIGSLIVLFLMR